MPAWTDTFYDGAMGELWSRSMPAALTEAEADFLEDRLYPPPDARLLDVPCGHGRHLAEMASRGWAVTGVDGSPAMLAKARAATKGLPVTLIESDMRTIPADPLFDGAWCLGNSLAALDRAGLADFFAALAEALRPGARLVVDSALTAETLLPAYEERLWIPVEDARLLVENHYDAAEGRLDTIYTAMMGDHTESREAVHWIITASELRFLMEQAGFDVLEMLAELQGEPFTLGSENLIMVAERR